MSSPVTAAPPIGSSQTSQDTVVRVTGLSKRFPVRGGGIAQSLRRLVRPEYKPALQDVTCEVKRGEFFGLLGPNGAGKTTLFKLLSTLIVPDGGTAMVAGYDIRRQPDQVRRVLSQVIADERSLHYRISARENLKLFAALHGLDSRLARERVQAALDTVGLADTGDQLAGSFSSGMKQRLLIARSLLARPTVLLLDEPTRSLDPLAARNFRAFLREEIAGRQGCTVLLATHNADEALELCDRVAILNRGRLLAVGSTEQLNREFGDERYVFWARPSSGPAWSALETRGFVRRLPATPADDGDWSEVALEIPGGAADAAQAVTHLVLAGIEIARVERSSMPLASLIERIVEREQQQGQRDNA
ncbi:MAG: ABC transporter ATP-binding protein [Gemmatimonadaceae bacterium]